MSRSMGAGFYASNSGVMPYVAGFNVPDTYEVWQATQPFRIHKSNEGSNASEQSSQ